MNSRPLRTVLLMLAALALLPDGALADPVRRALHLQTLDGLHQAASRIPASTFVGGQSRTELLQQLDALASSIEQDQFAAAAAALAGNVLPTLDGSGSPADILQPSRTKTNLHEALLELHDVLASEAKLNGPGQSNTRVSFRSGLITYQRLNGPDPTPVHAPLLGGQFFPFWKGFTEPDPDGRCSSPGDDSASGCLGDPSVVNGDNQRTVVLDRLGSPARTAAWSYEFDIASDGTAVALTPVWSTFLRSSERNNVNFVRIFGSFASIPEFGGNHFPWQVQGDTLQVKDAICDDHWDEQAQTGRIGYFDRLRGFIAAADALGVAVQFSLFVRQEIDPMTIDFGTWSPIGSDVAGANFSCSDGLSYAMPRASGPSSATFNFFDVEDDDGLTPIGRVQQRYIRKIVRELLTPSPDVPSGFTNIVFEVMNEPLSSRLRPNYPAQEVVRRWQAFVIRTIRETEAELRLEWPAVPSSVISLNAVPSSSRANDYDEMDVYEWRAALDQKPNDPVLRQLDEVGLINYHGYFSPGVLEEDLSLSGLDLRISAHVKAFGPPGSDKAIALLTSTDGMRIGAGDAAAPGSGDPLASVQEISTCADLAASRNANGDTVDLGRSNCRIAPNVGPCAPSEPEAAIGAECATAHGVPSLLRVFRTGFRNELVTGPNFAVINFIEDVALRTITGTGLRPDPGSRPRQVQPPREPGAYHFHNQSPFEDALEDMAKVPRPTTPVPTVPLDGWVVLLLLGLALGRLLSRSLSSDPRS